MVFVLSSYGLAPWHDAMRPPTLSSLVQQWTAMFRCLSRDIIYRRTYRETPCDREYINHAQKYGPPKFCTHYQLDWYVVVSITRTDQSCNYRLKLSTDVPPAAATTATTATNEAPQHSIHGSPLQQQQCHFQIFYSAKPSLFYLYCAARAFFLISSPVVSINY